MNKIVYDLLLKLEQCDDKHNRCDYLMEHDEITYLLEHIEEKEKQLDKYKNVIDKIKEYINENKKRLYQGRNEFTCEIQYSDEVIEVKDIEKLLEEVE